MYANGNAADVSGLDRASVSKVGVSREKGDIAEHAHVTECFRIDNPSRQSAPQNWTQCAMRGCLQVVCGSLATEKQDSRGRDK